MQSIYTPYLNQMLLPEHVPHPITEQQLSLMPLKDEFLRESKKSC